MKRIVPVLMSALACLAGAHGATGQEHWKQEPLMLALNRRHPRSPETRRIELVREILASDPKAIERATAFKGGPLISAIGSKDAALVELLLEHGADPNVAYGELRTTALERAIREQRASIVRSLLEAGATVRQRDLVRATRDGLTRCMELLLGHGADEDAPDSSGVRPVMAAAEAGQIGALGFLLGRGAQAAPPDARTQPLHLAAERGHTEIVRLLLDHGAPLEGRDDRSGLRAVECAVLRGHEDLLQLLVARGTELNPFVQVALMRTPQSEGEQPVLLGLLGEPEELVNARLEGQTLLHVAARFGCSGAARSLLAAGVDPKIATDHLGTPLLVASRHGNLAVARLLLESGSDPSTANSIGETPLHAAAGTWRLFGPSRSRVLGTTDDTLALVRLLLEGGADVNARLKPTLYVGGSWQPLHVALWGGRVDIAVELIRAGAETEWESPSAVHVPRRDLLEKAIEQARR